MRKAIACVLLLAITWSVIRPVLPYLDYAVHKDYISEILCINKNQPKLHCNGKCHLKKQLEELQSDTPNKNLPSKKRSIVNEIKLICLPIINQFCVHPSDPVVLVANLNSTILHQSIPEIDSPPPQPILI